jgi:hypothetical protein
MAVAVVLGPAALERILDRKGVRRETAIRFGAKASAVARKQAHAHTHSAAVSSREGTPNIMVQKLDGIIEMLDPAS